MINIGWLTLTKLLKPRCMNKKLKEKIRDQIALSNLVDDFNEIPNYDNSKRIIFYTLKPEGMTIASNSTK